MGLVFLRADSYVIDLGFKFSNEMESNCYIEKKIYTELLKQNLLLLFNMHYTSIIQFILNFYAWVDEHFYFNKLFYLLNYTK